MDSGSQAETTDLVFCARAGDKDAFTELVKRYQDGIYAYMLGRLADPQKAQEVTQDAFTTAYTTLHRLEKPGSFRSWVIGIAHNLARRRKKEIADVDLLEGAGDKTEEGLNRLETKEKIDAVRQAIAELPENYRIALMLHYFDKQRGRQIGEALGVSEGAVHMILLRARKALAEKLKAYAPDEA